MYALVDDLKATKFTLVLGLLFVVLGAGSWINRSRLEHRHRHWQDR